MEDSGSEVEIIKEVKGNGRSNHQPSPAFYMEELPPNEQYLQDQANAVLSLVTPEAELKVSAPLKPYFVVKTNLMHCPNQVKCDKFHLAFCISS